MAVVRHQRSRQKPPGSSLLFTRTGVQPSPDSSTIELPPPSLNLVHTHPIEHYQALRDSAPCLSRAATLPKGIKLGLGRGGTWEHHPQPTIPPPRLNRQAIAKAASWLHLLRVSPAPHPPERPSHTHTPKPRFRGRGHTSCDPTRNARGNVCSCWMSCSG